MHDIDALKELLKEPKEVMITTHHKPDADALGSSLGLAGYLKKKGHRVTVITPSDYPNFLAWMQGNDEVLVYSDKNDALVRRIISESQVIFCLDFSALSRISEMGEYIREAKGTKVLVDHHLEPENFADLDYSNSAAAATAELVYDLIKAMGDGDMIDTQIGECLYAGIMTDTGSFRHPSTSKNVHLIIADLLHIGVNTSNIHRLIYDSSSELRLRFLGYALKDKLVVLREYNTAYFAITAEELKAYDSKTGDTEGLVNFALSIEGIVFAAIIIDRSQAVKMSFRSVGSFSVNEFARQHFSGGGHRNAAGGISYEPLEATVEKFESLLPLYKTELLGSNN
ncbi:bifunctional oligoribonuclease/PAP phosphatase NrnA [Pontibacter qinzhouensis]|uniref:Bifunctional oligoribonuclease/PAP phosphatase NrnA n=1 Tax=Pontibacter qinzhouensis TaxID=2603253 RepID=A0A5C8K9F9_9BACT|nr:bifunctional oligoribonuclease/PAP phosphatase NrnA [Pontibacter qinzhouensis]TXK46455.1 bifunctional oligoribonuclease/PAP phosphatase NrnA [Pontibacter qinzhouensis]